MKASIVIPAYNEEKSIADTIRAVLVQDYSDFEVIVVNNASTDCTREIASRFAIKVVDEPNKGLLWARERGRLESNGEIIVNIDADCLPEKNWLSSGMSRFAKNGVVAVAGPYDYYDATPLFRKVSLLTQKLLYYPIGLFLQLPFIRGGAVMIGGNNFIRADILEKTGGYNTDLKFYGEDTDTAKRVSKYGRVIFDPKLTMKTSARRFKSEGTINLLVKYWYYFLKHIFFHRKPVKQDKK